MNAVINALILPLQFFKNKVSHVHQSEKKQNNKVADWECKWEKSQLFCVVVGIKYILLLVFVIVVIVALALYVGSVLCVFVVVLYWYRCGNVYVV